MTKKTHPALPNLQFGSRIVGFFNPIFDSQTLSSVAIPPKTPLSPKNSRFLSILCQNNLLIANFSVPDAQYQLPDAEYPFPDGQYQLPDAEYPFPDGQYQLPDAEYPFPDGHINFRMNNIYFRTNDSCFRSFSLVTQSKQHIIRYN